MKAAAAPDERLRSCSFPATSRRRPARAQPSAIEDAGSWAVAPITKDEIVAIKGGHIVDTPTLHSLPNDCATQTCRSPTAFTSWPWDETEYEPVMLFINHSCEPNVGFAGNIVLVAMRDISTGEELTTDYALFDDYDDVMDCQCGKPLMPRYDQRPRLATPRVATQIRAATSPGTSFTGWVPSRAA